MKPSFSLEHSLEISHEAVGAGSGLGWHGVIVTVKRSLSNYLQCG
jgi:hypothetical protein